MASRPETVLLPGGQALYVRPVTRADKPALRSGFDRLGADSRRRRFLRSVDRLDTDEITYLTEIDHHRHEALAAFDPAGAPVALERLARRAGEEGITTFTALAFASNDRIKALLGRLGPLRSTTPAAGVVEMVVDLGAPSDPEKSVESARSRGVR